MCLAGVFKCYFFHLRQIIVISILSLHIINEPTLVGKPVFEMIHSQWQCVELRLYGCKESSVRSSRSGITGHAWRFFSVIRATLVRLSLHQWLCVWLHHKIRVAARLPSRASLERFCGSRHRKCKSASLQTYGHR